MKPVLQWVTRASPPSAGSARSRRGAEAGGRTGATVPVRSAARAHDESVRPGADTEVFGPPRAAGRAPPGP